MPFSSEIKNFRLSCLMNQTEFGNALGVSFTTVNRWEKGKARQAGISLNIITRLKRNEYIAMQTIEKICIALDCGVDDILEFIPESQR